MLTFQQPQCEDLPFPLVSSQALRQSWLFPIPPALLCFSLPCKCSNIGALSALCRGWLCLERHQKNRYQD
jgi:hypothetical protein